MIPRPSVIFDFAGGSEYLDPRLFFSRLSTGPYYDRFRTLRYRPAGAPRLSWSPSTGLPLGLIMESARTNLLLRSEALDDAAWTKTGCTISADYTTAPDGNATADLLTVTAANGAVSQGITVTANNAVTLSWFGKAAASPFLWLQIGDGTNAVTGWFDLAGGSVGTLTAGNDTVTAAYAEIEAAGFGFHRATLHAYTSVSTAITCAASAARRDNVAPAIGDSIVAWGAAAAQAASYPRRGAYMATLGSTVAKAGELCSTTFDAARMSATAGTIVLEFAKPTPSALTYLATIGGSGATDQIQLAYGLSPGVNSGTVLLNAFSGGVAQASLQSATVAMAGDDPIRAAIAFAVNDFSLVVNGAAAVKAGVGALPTSWATLRIGYSSLGAIGMSTLRRLAYFPWRLTDAAMQALTG